MLLWAAMHSICKLRKTLKRGNLTLGLLLVGLFYLSGGWIPVSHQEDPSSIPGQFVWDL
jgi:hypothetical protein